MSNSTFQPSVLGMTAFMAPNRIDFVIDGPDLDKPKRESAFYNAPSAKLKLDGKALKIVEVTSDDDGEPNGLVVKWGRQQIRLGRRNCSGQVSFYRSLESQNDAAAPKTANEILNALQGFIA